MLLKTCDSAPVNSLSPFFFKFEIYNFLVKGKGDVITAEELENLNLNEIEWKERKEM